MLRFVFLHVPPADSSAVHDPSKVYYIDMRSDERNLHQKNIHMEQQKHKKLEVQQFAPKKSPS